MTTKKKKIQFDILTIFPEIFSAKGGSASGGDSKSYFDYSILGRAQKKGLVKIKAHDIRAFAKCDKHGKARPTRTGTWCGRCGRVDDKPFGGGAGMVMAFLPIASAIKAIKLKVKSGKLKVKTRVILFSTRGKKFTNKEAGRLAKYQQLVLICGRYEGVDERVAKHLADEELSIGDYVLTGGEIPAMVLVDAVSRQIPGVLGREESLEEIKGSYPVYTRPEVIEWKVESGKLKGKTRKYRVPKVLLSGNHKEIEKWRAEKSA